MTNVSVLALSWILAGSAAQQPEESVLESYDLRAVLPRWDADTSWEQTLVVPPAVLPYDDDHPVLEGSLQHGELAAYELLDLLTQILGDELRREGRELSIEGTRLTLLAPGAVQEQVRSVLATLERTLSTTLTLRVDVFSFAEGSALELAPASVLAAEEAERLATTLVGRGARQRRTELELSPGRTAWLDVRRDLSFLFDHDVEIAQGALVYDPVTMQTWEGMRLVLRGTAIEGGVALSTLMLSSDLLGDVAERELKLSGLVSHAEGDKIDQVSGPGRIQSPDLLVRGLAFDSFLPEGKALVLTLESDLSGGRLRELVLLRRSGAAAPGYAAQQIPRTNRTLVTLNGEVFRPPRFAARAQTWDDDGREHPSAVATLDAEPSTFLLEWLKARFSVWRRLGPWILIVTDPAWDRDAAQELERLVKARRSEPRLRTVAIDLRAPGREPVLPVRLRLPMLEGSSAGLVLGRAGTAVVDYDVEVAQFASVPDPRVSPTFEGLALALVLGTSTGTTLALELDGRARLDDGPDASIDPNYWMLGDIDLPRQRTLRFDERLSLPLSQAGEARARIGQVSERVDQPGLVLEIVVR